MSVLSVQVGELRDKAKLLRAHADGLAAPFVVPSTKELMALAMLDSASRMEEAAYTILSLQDRLQDAEDARYDAGFESGVKACLQQIDSLIRGGADVDEVQGWVDRQWEEEV